MIILKTTRGQCTVKLALIAKTQFAYNTRISATLFSLEQSLYSLLSGGVCRLVYVPCFKNSQTVPDNTPRLPACRLQQWHSQRKVTKGDAFINFIFIHQVSSVKGPSLNTDQQAKAGLHSRKTSQVSQVSGNHLPPPANRYWAQNRQEDGHSHKHQHGGADEVVELKTA